MRAAPAVSVRCTGGPLWRAWCALLPALAAGAFAAWVGGHLGQAVPGAAIGLALAGALLAWAWWRPPGRATRLAWDGHHWTADETGGALAVMLDLGPWMLLRLQAAAGWRASRWVPVGRHEAGAAWHLLRAAAYARPPLGPNTTRRAGAEGTRDG